MIISSAVVRDNPLVVGLCLVGVLVAGLATPSLGASSKQLDFSDAGIWISPKASEKEVQAARELQTYLYSISQKKPAIRELANGRADGRPAIIVGTVKGLSGLAGGFQDQGARLKTGTDEAFALHVGTYGGVPTALILANEPIGALYGAYTFLEKFGVGFYLGGDVLPGHRVPLHLSETDEFWNPSLPIRGCVIWVNFLCGPMTWDLEDYKYFFDQMVKMKANLVSFPEFGFGFTNYLVDGKLVPGVPLGTSANYASLPVRGMKTSEFGFGTGEFFAGPVFGSKATVEAREAQDAIRRSQELMAQAVAYAQQRGIRIGLGFQLDGHPDETNLKDVESRLRVLVTKYPGVGYVWFWQGEGASAHYPFYSPDSAVPDLVKEQVPHFAYLKNDTLALEAARMTVYVRKAYETLKAIAPNKHVVISGWGGDKTLHFTDLFPGLDETLPEDIIFSALDNIDPASDPHVSEFYGKVRPDRQRWAIPWWESDGAGTRRDMWMPQCNTRPFSALLPDVLRKGCQGILGIHWRVRAVADVAAYTMDFAWDPTKATYESFWSDFALRCFGQADAREMSELLMELDALGPRWTGGGGQAEAGQFTWTWTGDLPKKDNLQTLQRIRQRLLSIAERDRRTGRTQHLDRLERLINTIDWVTLYDEAAVQILAAQAKCGENKSAASEMLAKAPLGKAMRAYTRLLYTQGDWGVLSTVNIRAYASFEKTCKECGHAAVPGIGGHADQPVQVAFKNPNKIVPRGEPLTVRVIVTGGESVESVRLHYRALGEGSYAATPMTRGFRNLYQAVIPASAVTEDGLEYYIEARSVGNELFRVPRYLPSIAVTVVRKETG